MDQRGRPVEASALCRVTFYSPLAPLGETVASVVSRVRGAAQIIIVRNYAGHHISEVGAPVKRLL